MEGATAQDAEMQVGSWFQSSVMSKEEWNILTQSLNKIELHDRRNWEER